MLGFLLTVAFTLVAALAVDRWTSRVASFDRLERFGVAGAVGLGAVGTLTLVVGLLPGGFRWGLWVIVAAAAVLAALRLREIGVPKLAFKRPEGLAILLPVGVFAALAIALLGALSPSTINDWDSLAYHLAVPKIWLEAGQIEFLVAQHHSNFPFVGQNLFLYGLTWGGEAGAKAFSWCWFGLAAAWSFGFSRRRFGAGAAWWSCLATVTIPVALWEAGTAYVDLPHGLFAAMTIVYLAQAALGDASKSSLWWLAGITLGLTVGTKTTGLQVGLSVCVVTALALTLGKSWRTHGSRFGAFVALAVLVGGGWFVRTWVNTGNPVYPFLYEVFGGVQWDQWRADIYRGEQQTFGVGRSELSMIDGGEVVTEPKDGLDLSKLGHALLGLSYQPGRYVNPAQWLGGGSPTGALGFGALLVGALWAISGLARREERFALGAVGLLLLMWFVLSQQSRYLTIVAMPLATIAGGLVLRPQWGRAAAASIAMQAICSVVILYLLVGRVHLQVVTGRLDADEYRALTTPFAEPAEWLNSQPNVEKVALYDEVFGYLLDVPYLWANPGHAKLLPYEEAELGADLVAGLREQSVSHVYLNFSFQAPADRDRWLATAGLAPGEPWSEADREARFADLNLKWGWLVADAVRGGDLRPVMSFDSGLVLAVAP